MNIRVALEMGPKGKKCVAVAPDWPGLERGAKTPELAVENLRLYFHRYVRVAELAGLEDEFSPDSVPDVVERYPGVGSTDFWGISFAFSSIDERAMSNGELNRELALMQACWEHFDVVRKQVSPQMRKGPRGGGRDRDHIVRHTLAVEQDWAKKARSPHAPGRGHHRNKETEDVSPGLLRGDSGSSRQRPDGSQLAPPVSDSPHGVSHDGPRVGDGR